MPSHRILSEEPLLRTALTQFLEHYHEERNRQVKNNVLLFRAPVHLSPVGDVASAVENALAAYSGTTAAPHEYFDHTGAGRQYPHRFFARLTAWKAAYPP